MKILFNNYLIIDFRKIKDCQRLRLKIMGVEYQLKVQI